MCVAWYVCDGRVHPLVGMTIHYSHTFIFPMISSDFTSAIPTDQSQWWGLMNYAVITIFHMIQCDYKTASLN